jgi:hypothetical protein
MANSYGEVLDALLNAQNSHELSIIKLSEPISGALKQHGAERTSDVSEEVFENPTPASLEADLAHYKVRQYTAVEVSIVDSSIGALLETSILLPRTSHQREIYTRHRW